MHDDAVKATKRRLLEFESDAHYQARYALQRRALDGAFDIADEFYESCCNVVLFELWKLRRLEVWTEWLEQQRHHMLVFEALMSHTGFAGVVYNAASSDLRRVLRRKELSRQRQMNAAKSAAAEYEKNWKKAPLFIQEFSKAPVENMKMSSSHMPDVEPKAKSRSKCSTSGLSIPEDAATRRGANRIKVASSFSDRILHRLRQVSERTCSSGDHTTTQRSYLEHAGVMTVSQVDIQSSVVTNETSLFGALGDDDVDGLPQGSPFAAVRRHSSSSQLSRPPSRQVVTFNED